MPSRLPDWRLSASRSVSISAPQNGAKNPTFVRIVENIEALEAAPAVQENSEAAKGPEADRKAMLEQTAELLSLLDRKVRFEVLEDAGLVQIQVIDSRDDSVIRRVPSDEVVRFLEFVKERMQEQIDEQLDVLA